MTLDEFVTALFDDLAIGDGEELETQPLHEASAYQQAYDIQLSSSDDFLNLSILEEIRYQKGPYTRPYPVSLGHGINKLTEQLVQCHPRVAENRNNAGEANSEVSDSFCDFLNDLARTSGSPERQQVAKANTGAATSRTALRTTPSVFLRAFGNGDYISSICSPKITSFLSADQPQVDFKIFEVYQKADFEQRQQLYKRSIERLCRIANNYEEATPQPITLMPPSPSAQNISLEPPVTRARMLQIEPRLARPNLGVCLRYMLSFYGKLFYTAFPDMHGDFADVLGATESIPLYQIACAVYLDKSVTDCNCARFVDLCRAYIKSKAFLRQIYAEIGPRRMRSEALAALVIKAGQKALENPRPEAVSESKFIVYPFQCAQDAERRAEMRRDELKKQAAQQPNLEGKVRARPAQRSASATKTPLKTPDKVPVFEQPRPEKPRPRAIGPTSKAEPGSGYRNATTKAVAAQPTKRASSAPSTRSAAQKEKIAAILAKYNNKHPEKPPLLYKEVAKLLVDAKIIRDADCTSPCAKKEVPQPTTMEYLPAVAKYPPHSSMKIDANAHAAHSPRLSAVDSRVLTSKTLRHARRGKTGASNITEYSLNKLGTAEVLLLRDARHFSRQIASDALYDFGARYKVHFDQRVCGVRYEKAACELGVWENNYLDDADELDA